MLISVLRTKENGTYICTHTKENGTYIFTLYQAYTKANGTQTCPDAIGPVAAQDVTIVNYQGIEIQIMGTENIPSLLIYDNQAAYDYNLGLYTFVRTIL